MWFDGTNEQILKTSSRRRAPDVNTTTVPSQYPLPVALTAPTPTIIYVGDSNRRRTSLQITLPLHESVQYERPQPQQ